MIDLIFSIFSSYFVSIANHLKRFNSFCPIYDNNETKFYINGYLNNYFEDVYEQLLSAQKEVFINGWWISPQLYLKRPYKLYPESRLDKVLTKIAEEGVQIYIIIYREIEGTLYNNSAYTKKFLMNCHKNIKIIRHPKYFIHIWSHHEKMVIIDSDYAFLGGLDLCFGRYEEINYPLSEKYDQEQKQIWKGLDYSNPRIKDFQNVQNWKEPLIDKNSQPRMPWRDIAVRVKGDIVVGLRKHFLRFWNFNNIQFSQKKSLDLISQDEEFEEEFNFIMRKTQEIKFQSLDLFKETKLEDLNLSQQIPIQNIIIALEKINCERQTQQFLIEEEETEIQEQLKEGFPQLSRQISKNNHNKFLIQALRSGSEWSLGLEKLHPETSILNAYLSLIDNSKKFIYIENQFFVSSTANLLVQNEIAAALAKRIIRSIQQEKEFVVFLIFPLLPGFEGDITKKNGQLVRIQLDWQLNTLYKSNNSLIKQIQRFDKNWKKYLKIFGLRNHSLIKNKPVSEIVYVHSKLMIVDDKQVIVGSANINDRSMIGTRDSELALIIEGQNLEKVNLGGSVFQNQKQIAEFRKNCMKSIFGINHSYDDPLDQIFLKAIQRQAKINKNFYWSIFKIYPHNSLKTLQQVQDVSKIFKIKEKFYYQFKERVKGFAVPWPVFFLEEEQSLVNKFLDVGTFILPQIIFT